MTWPCYIENRTILRRVIMRLNCMYARCKFLLNSFKPGILFMGHRHIVYVTPQNTAPHQGLFCLLRGISLKNGIKFQNHT